MFTHTAKNLVYPGTKGAIYVALHSNNLSNNPPMNRRQILEEAYADFDLADAFRIACEMSIDVTKPEPWLRVYYDTVSKWGAGFRGPEWQPAFIHSLVVLIREAVEDKESSWQWETLPEGAQELCDQDQVIAEKLAFDY